MNKPKLEHIQKAIEYIGEPVGCNPALWFIGVNTRINEIALAEQQESEYIEITAEQARELGAGNAEWLSISGDWYVCDKGCPYRATSVNDESFEIKYRAIKQAQPEPTDELRPKQPTWTGSREDVVHLINSINKTAPNCERHKLLLEHFKALLVEQSRRAKESK